MCDLQNIVNRLVLFGRRRYYCRDTETSVAVLQKRIGSQAAIQFSAFYSETLQY